MLGVLEGIAVAARRNPATPALITGNKSLTYGNLLDAVARVSRHLLRQDLPPRAKLFLNIADPDLRLVVMIAAMHAGHVPFAVLDPSGMDDVDHDVVVGAAAPHLPALAADIIVDPSIFAGDPADGLLPAVDDQPDEAIAFIASTTGSTGRPKLVAITHGCMRGRDRSQGLVPGEGYMLPVPWHAVAKGERMVATFGDVTYGGIYAVFLALAAGATSIRASRDRLEILAHINLYCATRIASTAGIVDEMMDRMDEKGIACPSVRHVSLSGSLVDEATVRRIATHFDAEIATVYGSTETATIASCRLAPDSFEAGCVGDIFPGVRLIASGSPAEPAPLVVVREPTTHAPYYAGGKVVATNDTFFTLPDLGYVRGNRVYIVGRDDEVLNISGNKIAYSAIDSALRAMAGVRDVAVVSAASVGDPSGLVIGVVGEKADLAGLVNRVCGIVKAPETASHLRLFSLPEIPRNAFGKMDRGLVIAAYRRHAEGGAGRA